MDDHIGGASPGSLPRIPGQDTIPALLAWYARERPGAVAVSCWHDTLTWEELAARAFAIAWRLRQAGVAPGDRIAYLCRDRLGIDEVATLYGIVAAAALVAVPADLPLPVQRRLVERTAPAALVAQPGTDPTPLPAVPLLSLLDLPAAPGPPSPLPGPRDLAAIISTSGSSAESKLVLRTHQNIVRSSRITSQELGLGPDDRMLMLGSPSAGMFVSTFDPLWSGGGLVLPTGPGRDRWPPDGGALTPTWAFGAPARLAAIADAMPDGPSPFRIVLSSGASAPPGLAERIARGLRAPRVDLYAASEVYSMAFDGRPTVPLRIAPAGGRLPESGETGEIQVSGDLVFPGYHGDPALTAAAFTADGWYRTGDLGRLREDGTLELLGRLNQLINQGGTKIAPEEI
ncbi:MAG: class I adenylate-forming enzyme family protein [Chloroflexota bacterium]